jgi:hypothetical protein
MQRLKFEEGKHSAIHCWPLGLHQVEHESRRAVSLILHDSEHRIVTISDGFVFHLACRTAYASFRMALTGQDGADRGRDGFGCRVLRELATDGPESPVRRRRCRIPAVARCRCWGHCAATVIQLLLSPPLAVSGPEPPVLPSSSPFDGSLRPDGPPDAGAARPRQGAPPSAGAPPAPGACAGEGKAIPSRPLPRMRQRSDRGMPQGGWATIIPLLRFVLDGSLGCFLSR